MKQKKEIKALVALNFVVECIGYPDGRRTYVLRRGNNGQPIELSSDISDLSESIVTMVDLAVDSVAKVDNV